MTGTWSEVVGFTAVATKSFLQRCSGQTRFLENDGVVMKNHRRPAVDVERQVKSLHVRCVRWRCRRHPERWWSRGFALNGTNHFGDTILEYAISVLEFYPEAPKYAVVQEMLRLGANPRRSSARMAQARSLRPLLNLDTEMLRLLLDAGADPNVGRIRVDGAVESLYDWAHSAYLVRGLEGPSCLKGVTPAERAGRRRPASAPGPAWPRSTANKAPTISSCCANAAPFRRSSCAWQSAQNHPQEQYRSPTP
jgi:hypothetical protein